MFYLIDKPVGISSFSVIRTLRKKTAIKKMGYVGTLDPLASGILLVATGNSTKLIPLLEGFDKTYTFTAKIDGSSPSLDLGTPVVPVSLEYIQALSAEMLQKKLLAQTSQIPPIYSAIHLQGKRSYTLARQGLHNNQDMPTRNICVSCVKILEISIPAITIRMRISSGGYIRSFAPLLAKWLGSDGGYISQLRRDILHIPGYDISKKDAQNLEEFDEKKHISLLQIFPTYLHISLWNKIHGKMLEDGTPISINLPKKYEGQSIFVTYSTNRQALMQYKNGVLTIIKNMIA